MRNPAAWSRWLWPVLLWACGGVTDSAAAPFGSAGAPSFSTTPSVGLPVGAPGAINPGRVVAHRLNRVEYDNTIRDLFGVDSKPSREFGFPEDNYVEGFDNNALSLTASPLLLEKYQTAASAIVSRALASAPSRAQIMTCDPVTLGAMPCATQILTVFATRAFRRPVMPDEITPYTALFATATSVGDGFEQVISTALEAMLLSPKFVFRTEQNGVPGQVAPLAVYELASRLSYFIWSSMPDAELTLRAADQSLLQPAEIRKQVARMLANPKASALVDNLAGQWLATRELAVKQITLKDFTLDDAMRQAIAQEASMFLSELLHGQHTISELLASDFTYVNKALAQHYGMPEAATLGTAMQRVAVTDPNRRAGLLTQTNFLMVSSQRDRTSPTRRGKWVSENLLCVVIPPPPPKIPELVMNDATMPTSTRERLEAHRRKGSTCNGCHMYMDPLGLAFEHYDAVGRYRTTDLGAPIDTTGEIPVTNVAFNGISVDQLIANELKLKVPGLRLPSLELGAVYAGATGNCEDGFSCAYLTNLAWSGPTTFLPKETNPKAVFDRLTKGGLPMPATGMVPPVAAPSGGSAPVISAATPDKARAYQKSILDLVVSDTNDLNKHLGKSDRDKLSDYLDSVNELQRRVQALAPATGAAGMPSTTTNAPVAAGGMCQSIAAPMDGTYLGGERNKNIYEYPELLKTMNDLMAFAVQCDLTRVITVMSEIPLNTQTNFSFIGVESSNYHDEITHHGGNSTKLAGMQKVNTFYAEQFAYFLSKLSTMQDADGSSVLDNSIIMFTSEFGDGDNHYHYDLPVVLAGGAGGQFKTGRHIAYPSTPDKGSGSVETARRQDMPLANLYISIMQAFGMNVSTFGSVDGTTPYGTKPLSELTTI